MLTIPCNADVAMLTIVQCPCRELRLELSTAPMAQFYCHCDDCQMAHGAGYVLVSMYPASAVMVVAGAPLVWCLKTTPRTTCPQCGTRMFATVPGYGVRGVNALLLPPGQFRPAFHVHCQFARFPLKDDLPHYKSLPARFGGSDELMQW